MSTPETTPEADYIFSPQERLEQLQNGLGRISHSAITNVEAADSDPLALSHVEGELARTIPIERTKKPKGEADAVDLYAKIVPVSEIENYLKRDDPRAIDIVVSGDQTIKIGERELEISKHELYLFNALLKLRDKPRDAKELRAFGFYPGQIAQRTRNATFLSSLTSLSALLRFSTGEEIISTFGTPRSNSYQLSPNLVMTDRRIAGQSERKPVRQAIRGVRAERPPSPTNARDLPFIQLLNRYGQHKKVKAAENRLAKDAHLRFNNDDIVGDYMNVAGQYVLLKKNEVESLYEEIESGLATQANLENLDNVPPDTEQLLITSTIAIRTMFLSNLRLVINLAKDYKDYEMMDVIAEGNRGLMQAISHFDYRKGFAFSTYATNWIRQAMQKAVANQARQIRLPADLDIQARQLGKIIQELSETQATKPSMAQLMELSYMDKETITSIQIHGSFEHPSLDAPLAEDSQSTLLDMIGADRSSIGIEELTNGMSDREELLRILFRVGDNIPNIGKAVLVSSYEFPVPFYAGMEIQRGDKTTITYEEFLELLPKDRAPTYSELGIALRYSHERIRKIKNNAILRVRQGSLPPKDA